jgi:hypothetical protein
MVVATVEADVTGLVCTLVVRTLVAGGWLSG